MEYRAELTSRAEADAYAAYEFIKAESPDAANRWLIGLFQAIFSLGDLPKRCGVIPEAREIGRELRHLLYGRSSAAYRIIFDTDEESEDGPLVRVLRIWRGSRDQLRSEDLENE